MTDRLTTLVEASETWEPRPLPDLGGVMERGRAVRRRRRMAAAATVAAGLVLGAAGYGAAARLGSDQSQVVPAHGESTTPVTPRPPLTYDWPQGYAPPATPAYAGVAPKVTFPAGTEFHTVQAGELRPATRGPLAGVANAAVTIARVPDKTVDGEQRYQPVFLAGGKDGRVLTVDDRLTREQLASVRALYLAYASRQAPLGSAADLLAWSFPGMRDGVPFQTCGESEVADPGGSGDVRRSRTRCEETFSWHPNTFLYPTPESLGREYDALQRDYVPCVRQAGVPLDRLLTKEQFVADRLRWHGTEPMTYLFTTTPWSATPGPKDAYTKCTSWDSREISPVLQGAQNPPE